MFDPQQRAVPSDKSAHVDSEPLEICTTFASARTTVGANTFAGVVAPIGTIQRRGRSRQIEPRRATKRAVTEPLQAKVMHYLITHEHQLRDLRDANVRQKVIAATGANVEVLDRIQDLPELVYLRAAERLRAVFQGRNDLSTRGPGLSDVVRGGLATEKPQPVEKPQPAEERSSKEMLELTKLLRKALAIDREFPEFKSAVMQAVELGRAGDWAQVSKVLTKALEDPKLPESIRKRTERFCALESPPPVSDPVLPGPLGEFLHRFGEPKLTEMSDGYNRSGPWSYSGRVELTGNGGAKIRISAGFDRRTNMAELSVYCDGKRISVTNEAESRALRDLLAKTYQGSMPGEMTLVDTALERWDERRLFLARSAELKLGL